MDEIGNNLPNPPWRRDAEEAPNPAATSPSLPEEQTRATPQGREGPDCSPTTEGGLEEEVTNGPGQHTVGLPPNGETQFEGEQQRTQEDKGFTPLTPLDSNTPLRPRNPNDQNAKEGRNRGGGRQPTARTGRFKTKCRFGPKRRRPDIASLSRPPLQGWKRRIVSHATKTRRSSKLCFAKLKTHGEKSPALGFLLPPPPRVDSQNQSQTDQEETYRGDDFGRGRGIDVTRKRPTSRRKAKCHFGPCKGRGGRGTPQFPLSCNSGSPQVGCSQADLVGFHQGSFTMPH